MNAAVLCLFSSFTKNSNVFTPFAKKIDEQINGELSKKLKIFGHLAQNKTIICYDCLDKYPVIVLVGLGPIDADFNELEELYEKRDNIRKGVASAISALRNLNLNFEQVYLDDCDDPQSVAEGAYLSDWRFDELKNDNLKRKPFKFNLANEFCSKKTKWRKGVILSEYQNICRKLQEIPANLLTPTAFSEEAKKLCEPLNVKVIVHDTEWAKTKKMGLFLSVTHGSDEPAKFVELHYKNCDKKPLVLVGKGITFDSGGISLKPASRMDLMRADMGGGATVLCTIAALAKLNAKVNVIGLIPLTENLISGKATKPGDVFYAMNGTSVQIDNTDAEGRLILADALCYADEFDPELVLDIATLTGAVKIALGQAATAVYSTNEKYWQLIRTSGWKTGDRVWRMPLFSNYTKKVKDSHLADYNNINMEETYGAGSCVAAAFLREFTKCKNWLHLDMAGTKFNTTDVSYISKGMSGRPMRTLVKFVQRFFKKKI